MENEKTIAELDNNVANGNTKCDLAISRSLVMNGTKLPGVSKFMVDYDVDQTITKVTMVMCIKKNSLKVSSDTISFETVTEPKVVVA